MISKDLNVSIEVIDEYNDTDCDVTTLEVTGFDEMPEGLAVCLKLTFEKRDPVKVYVAWDDLFDALDIINKVYGDG